MARVLITGATGLLGRWTLRHWPANLENVAVSHQQTDLLDPAQFVSAIRVARPDTLLHLAWSASGASDYRHSSDNALWVSASTVAAEHCLKHGIRFIGTGTGIDNKDPVDAYSRSKTELRKRFANEIESGTVTWLRPFHVFDLAAARPSLIAQALEAIDTDEPVRLRTPMARHDFVHASDVGSAIVASLVHDLRGSIDIGSGRLRSVAELVESCGASWRRERARNPSGRSGAAANQSALLATGWAATATEMFFTASSGSIDA